MKAIVFALAVSTTALHAADKKPSDAGLPQKSPDKDDPLSLENLLDPGKPVPEILPDPEVLPEAKPTSGSGGKITAGSAKSALIAAANDYRRKTELFRKGKLNRDTLRDSAIRVAQTAKTYRAALRR